MSNLIIVPEKIIAVFACSLKRSDDAAVWSSVRDKSAGKNVANEDGRGVWYFFRSDALREIVYETMLSDQRRALHQQVGEWYERELLSCTAPDAERFQHEGNAGVDGENGDEKVSMSWGTATDHSSVSGTVPEDKEEIDLPSGNEGSRNGFASSPTRSSPSPPRKSSPMNLARSSSDRSFSGCVAGVPGRRTHRSGQEERPSVFNASLATARRVIELYPPLAYHWSRSGVLEKAIAYLKLAAESAAFQGMYTEAEKWHRECLVLKEQALDVMLANRAALAVQAKLESMQRDVANTPAAPNRELQFESMRGDTNTPAASADDLDRDSDSDDSVDYNEEDEDDRCFGAQPTSATSPLCIHVLEFCHLRQSHRLVFSKPLWQPRSGVLCATHQATVLRSHMYCMRRRMECWGRVQAYRIA